MKISFIAAIIIFIELFIGKTYTCLRGIYVCMEPIMYAAS